MSYLIVGLGNPGEEYVQTRHNTGRMIVENLAKKAGAELTEDKKLNALVGSGTLNGEKITFLNPNTFMNNSGKAVGPKVKTPKQAKQLIVIHDDLDLPLGILKISWNRGAGGHRGVESIIKAIKTQEFIRFRVGISTQTAGGKLKKPHGEEAVDKHIIGKFKPTEMTTLKKISKIAEDAVEIILSNPKVGLARAMTQCN